MHGTLGDFRSWRLQMALFAQRYRVIAYSRRCHWPNAWPDEYLEYSATDHASDLGALIDALGYGPAHLVGSSYGALTALVMAAARPALVRTLVLGEPPLLPWLTATPEGSSLHAAFESSAWEPARQAFRRGDPEGGVRLSIDGVMGEGGFNRLPPPARAMMIDNAPEMGLELETSPETHIPVLACADTKRVQTPALLLTGELSPRMFHYMTDELARCLPSGERAVIPNASHGMHLGNPQAYTETVLAFLSRHRSPVHA